MTKRIVVLLGIVFVLMMTGCGKLNGAEEPIEADNQMMEKEDISTEDLAKILQEYLISVNKWESEYVLEPLDSILGEIENEEIFRFEIRYMDDMDEVGGRLIDNYAITPNGQKIFWYNSAVDEWVQQNG